MESSKIKSLEESVVTSMDGSDAGLFPFFPYILQDSWEIGSDPDVIIGLVRRHVKDYTDLRVLDLGCGKGAVSVKIAKELNCRCLGIDAIKEFIDEANRKACEYGVDHLCRFELGDIRQKVKVLTGFDIVILGSIGPVFGDYSQTLKALERCIEKNGKVIIDDGYVKNDSEYSHPLILKQDVILNQIADSGMKLLGEAMIDRSHIKESNILIFENLKKRCQELIKKYPDKGELFNRYIEARRRK